MATRATAGWKRFLRVVGVAAALLMLATCYATQPVLERTRSPDATAFDAARLERHVRMLSRTLAPRDASDPAQLDKAADYIRAEFKRAGGRIADQPFAALNATYRNVIASFGPEDGERIVVGAHYDACDPLPGADDNASGVAGLIELAYALGKNAPQARIDLVAYTLEEPPFFDTPYMGSAVHAKTLKDAQVSVRLMISLEMIGYFSDAPGSQRFPSAAMAALYPTTGNFIAVVGDMTSGLLVRGIKRRMLAASDLPVYSMNAPASVMGVDLSDHRSYWAQGYPAVMITDTAFFRNAAYHTAEDTAERLDYARMAKVMSGVYAVISAEH